jgi:hypothetical protein
MTTFLSMTLALVLHGAPPKSADPPKQSGIAPSLRALTDEEEQKLDEIIDRFIEQDTGKLKGEEGKKAKKEFEKLGRDAIPALIRGLNRAAAIEHSCPVLVIAKKLNKLLASSDDLELLEFARENIGAGVGRTRHSSILKDLRVSCMLRSNVVKRKQAAAAAAGPKQAARMTVAELTSAAGSERGARLKQVLTELEKRRGDEVISALGTAAAASYDKEIQELARSLLGKHLSRQKIDVIKARLGDDSVEVRIAAAGAVAAKKLKLGSELIDLLEDKEARVRDAAHKALLSLSMGKDYGPDAKAGDKERAEAIKKWREWWEAQSKR